MTGHLKIPVIGGSTPEQAAAWFARHRSGPWSEADAAEFATWLKTDPEHASAWAAYDRLWARVDTVRDDPKILAIRERARRNVERHRIVRRAWRTGGAVAASVLLGGFVLLNLPRWAKPLAQPNTAAQSLPSPEPANPLVREASTDIGERALLVLPDGSKLTLNTATTVRTDYSGEERRVTLLRGEAFFEVAKEAARPFVVSAGSRRVLALGTSFAVRMQERQVKVTLVEGKVEVLRTADRSRPGGAVMLKPGTALLSPESGDDRIVQLDTERATSWRNGKLVFDGERLADVVAEMNRYSREKLEIADAALQGRRVSGVFEPTGARGFAKALQAYGIARTKQETPTSIVLDTP